MSFLPGVPSDYVIERFRQAGGNEIESRKFESVESSAALAANCFAWFHTRPHLLPPFSEAALHPALRVDIEVCLRFPWSGGRHPWLDAVIETSAHLIGVESKRFEPFRDAKTASLSVAYDRPVWGDMMRPYEQVRDQLRSGALKYHHLDATQLVKHAFGLRTQAQKTGRTPVLTYLFSEPAVLAGRGIPEIALRLHRDEITAFAQQVQGAEVAFNAISYRDWIATWTAPDEVVEHGRAVLAKFEP